MILLFGEKANSSLAQKSGKSNNHPVENSGILAMNFGSNHVFEPGTLYAPTTDYYVPQNPVAVDYSMYNDSEFASEDCGFMSSFSNAIATIEDFGGSSICDSYSDCSCSCSDSGFSSMC